MKYTILLGSLVLCVGLLIAGLAASNKPVSTGSPVEAARLERGRYLVQGPGHCMMCHSEIDWTRPGIQPKKGREGAGQSPFFVADFPWLAVPNISPDPETGGGKWTDEQFARALRQGIGNDGRTLFPMMAYNKFHDMSDGDLAAVIAYIRSIPPVQNRVPPSQIPAPVQQSLRPLPASGPVPEPDRSSPVTYGKYLTQIANCTGCHTPRDERGRPIPEMEWAGGLNLVGPWGDVHSANLTPDPSGISYYNEDLFLKVIHTGNPGGHPLSPIMPWNYYRNMSDDDLKSIFAYLRTLEPVKHRIDNSSPRTPCKTCGGKHGLGDMNR